MTHRPVLSWAPSTHIPDKHKRIDPLAEQQDRQDKIRELLDGAGVIALLFGIPVVSAGFLAVELARWFG